MRALFPMPRDAQYVPLPPRQPHVPRLAATSLSVSIYPATVHKLSNSLGTSGDVNEGRQHTCPEAAEWATSADSSAPSAACSQLLSPPSRQAAPDARPATSQLPAGKARSARARPT